MENKWQADAELQYWLHILRFLQQNVLLNEKWPFISMSFQLFYKRIVATDNAFGFIQIFKVVLLQII